MNTHITILTQHLLGTMNFLAQIASKQYHPATNGIIVKGAGCKIFPACAEASAGR